MKTASVCTLGCKVSQYESRAIEEYLTANGVTVLPFHEVCDAYIINTCTVTAESDRKCRQMIRRAINRNPDAYIAVTGCYAQTQPEKIREIAGVDLITGSRDKQSAAQAVLAFLNGKAEKNTVPVNTVTSVLHHEIEPLCVSASERTRAYIKIEDGCENRCAYCAIPNARGLVASKQPEAVLEEIRGIVANGYREIVVTGIEVASYGRDHSTGGLIDLLEQIDVLPGIERIRLGSMEPTYMKPEVIDRMARLSHLMPHFHLSMQSGSADVLRGMRRRYRPDTALAIMENIRRAIPNVMFTTDMMTGFPGETDANQAETIAFIKAAEFLHIHVFPFSARENTPAFSMPAQVPVPVRNERAAALQREADRISGLLLDRQVAAHPVYPVLFEQYLDGKNSGHTPNFLEVYVRGAAFEHGVILPVAIAERKDNILNGEVR